MSVSTPDDDYVIEGIIFTSRSCDYANHREKDGQSLQQVEHPNGQFPFIWLLWTASVSGKWRIGNILLSLAMPQSRVE